MYFLKFYFVIRELVFLLCISGYLRLKSIIESSNIILIFTDHYSARNQYLIFLIVSYFLTNGLQASSMKENEHEMQT